MLFSNNAGRFLAPVLAIVRTFLDFLLAEVLICLLVGVIAAQKEKNSVTRKTMCVCSTVQILQLNWNSVLVGGFAYIYLSFLISLT